MWEGGGVEIGIEVRRIGVGKSKNVKLQTWAITELMCTTYSFCCNLHFQGKGSLVNNFKSISHTNLILSSLVSEFWQRIQIQEFFFGGMNMRAPYFLYTTNCHDLFYRTIQFHDNNPDGIQNREHCSLNNQGEITQKVWKSELSFLTATHRQDVLFYITVKYDNISKGIQVMEWTQNCIWNNQGEITQKVWKQELSFL